MKALFLFAALALPLTAQDEPQRKITLDFVSFGEDIPGLAVTSGGKEIPATALGFRYSQEVKYTGPAILELSQASGAIHEEPVDLEKHPDSAILLPTPAPADAPDGDLPSVFKKLREKNPQLVSLVPLPAGSSHATVLLAPGPEGSYLANVIDDNPANLPAGKIRIHNYSNTRIALTLNNGKPIAVEPRKSFLASPTNGQIIYRLAYEEDGDWKIQETNIVAITPKEKVHMIVLRSAATFFTSSDGSRSGHLQLAVLRRLPEEP